jgi:hypothetical protein
MGGDPLNLPDSLDEYLTPIEADAIYTWTAPASLIIVPLQGLVSCPSLTNLYHVKLRVRSSIFFSDRLVDDPHSVTATLFYSFYTTTNQTLTLSSTSTMFIEPKPAQVPDYLMMSNPKAVLRFVFAGVPRRFLRYMRHLRIQFDFPYQPWSKEHEMYLIAIRIVLRIVPELVDLVLLWNNVPSRVFDGVSFKLEALTCTMDMQGALDFLAQQSELRLVELPNWNTIPDALDVSQFIFPKLCELSVPMRTAVHLVPGRPVRSVDLRIAAGQEEADWSQAMQALAMSQCSVDDLAIATLTSFPLSILSSMKYLPYLRTLYIRVYGPEPTTTVRIPIRAHILPCILTTRSSGMDRIFFSGALGGHSSPTSHGLKPSKSRSTVDICKQGLVSVSSSRRILASRSGVGYVLNYLPWTSVFILGILYCGGNGRKSPLAVAGRGWWVVKGFVRLPKQRHDKLWTFSSLY